MEQDVGKTIERVEQGDTYVEIYYTDGTSTLIVAQDKDEIWISGN